MQITIPDQYINTFKVFCNEARERLTQNMSLDEALNYEGFEKWLDQILNEMETK